MQIKTVGSVCSGIEAASVALYPLGFEFQWFSEIAEFQSNLLALKYPSIPNLKDMNNIPEKILNEEIVAPDLICGGTPCQAFSLAGLQNGLNDERGNLTLKFVDIINANDEIRLSHNQQKTIVLWENVEGVLSDKTNAFGCFISSLAGFSTPIIKSKWTHSGFIHGPKRNVAWRVLDAKYFGVPQQRKRLYVVAGGLDFYPEDVLFEIHTNPLQDFPKNELTFEKNNHKFEVFREYADCLYSAYGTKWNGNAAATNGSLFVVQDGRIRRFTPLECERLMGFPDGYTNIPKARKTNRYKAIGNSWAVPVIQWIGKRILFPEPIHLIVNTDLLIHNRLAEKIGNSYIYALLSKNVIQVNIGEKVNFTDVPEKCIFNNIQNIVTDDVPDDLYLSSAGCSGILRRAGKRNTKINPRLKELLLITSSKQSKK